MFFYYIFLCIFLHPNWSNVIFIAFSAEIVSGLLLLYSLIIEYGRSLVWISRDCFLQLVLALYDVFLITHKSISIVNKFLNAVVLNNLNEIPHV